MLIAIAIAITASNIRRLRKWHATTGLGDDGHPLLSPDDEGHGHVQLTVEQAEALDAQHDRAA